MGWLSNFLTSTLGQKVVMSLTGLFLIVFLVIHLLGNLQLLAGDEGRAFNEYAYFMTHNPLIMTSSFLLYAFILIHAVQGLLLWRRNKAARGTKGYRERKLQGGSWASNKMAWLGIVIFIFIVIHMWQFWLRTKLGTLPPVMYEGVEYHDLYVPVREAFSSLGYVIFYVVSMIVIAFHLWHGFQSTFQSLGLRHQKYTPFIILLGKIYAIVVPLAFAIIPIIMYLSH